MGADEAQTFMDGFFARFPALDRFLLGQVEQAERDGYVETLCGRRRYLPELRSRNLRVRNFGRRVSVNTPIQGSAADLMKVAMIRLDRRFRRDGLSARMLLQLHDELLFEVPRGELEATARAVGEEMDGALALDVPLDVRIGAGPSWLDAETRVPAVTFQAPRLSLSR